MNKVTQKALRLSIAHWERMRDGTMIKYETTEGRHCALCLEFVLGHPTKSRCSGCPVAEVTGKQDCQGSPWWNAAGCEYDDPKRYELYDAEVQFLKGLLP